VRISRARGIPEKPALQRAHRAVVQRRITPQQAVRDTGPRAADVRDDVVDIREIENRLRNSQILQHARGLEVELDISRRVGCWVCFDERAVETDVGGCGMHVYDLSGATCVHGGEKWGECWGAQVVPFEVGIQHDSRGVEVVQGVCGFCDGGVRVGQRDDGVEGELLRVSTGVGGGLFVDEARESDGGGAVSWVYVCAGRGEGEDGVGYALGGREGEVVGDVPCWRGVLAGCWDDAAVPVWYAMRCGDRLVVMHSWSF
jgi:hypothetical protein